MPFKSKLITFMERKAEFLPIELRSVYFMEEDADNIKDMWENIDAFRVCKYIYESFDKNFLIDADMCPFCVKTYSECNKCEYFKFHGCCKNKHSDYRYVVDRIFGIRNVEKGIMEYILQVGGMDAINDLKSTLKANYTTYPGTPTPNGDGGGGTAMAIAA